MSFRVAARTLLQLGAELISSDTIAFYELIKNGFDAGSKRVELVFTIRIPADAWERCKAALIEATSTDRGSQDVIIGELRDTLIESVDSEIVRHSYQEIAGEVALSA